MTSPCQNNKPPRRKPESDGDIPMWQLVIGVLFMTVGGMLAGIEIAGMVMSLLMPGASR